MDMNNRNMIIGTVQNIFLKSKSNKKMIVFIISVENESSIDKLETLMTTLDFKKITFIADTNQNKTFLLKEIELIFSKSHTISQRTKHTDLVFVSIGGVNFFFFICRGWYPKPENFIN